METALYFPYIRVPETAWFTQILLYWDSAATIVPRSLSDDQDMLGRYMTELSQTRPPLLEFIHPDGELWPHTEAFVGNFLKLIAAHERELTAPQRPRRYTRVHTDKMGWMLFDELRARGLARHEKGPEWETWWSVEEHTADLYMAYLASVISGVRTDTFPITDQTRAMATLHPSEDDVITRLRELRYAAITAALPAPSLALPVHELRTFRDQHEEQLRRLRHHLDGRLADLAVIEDTALREVKTNSVLAEIRDDVAVLREQMEGRNWPRVIMIGIGGVVGAALAMASGVATAGGTLALGLAVAGGTASLAGAGYQATEIFREPRFNKRAPLAYAALAAGL
jgi:hypothetical protein